jgi:DNA repair protein RadC
MEIRLLQVRESTGEQVHSPESIANLMIEEARADRECLWVLHLNTRYEIIEKELVSMGSLDYSIASPREIFKKAILNSAYSIAIIHNHPGGGVNPSCEDIEIMKRLVKCGDILDISILDFMIIAKGDFWSGRENREEVFLNKIANLRGDYP